MTVEYAGEAEAAEGDWVYATYDRSVRNECFSGQALSFRRCLSTFCEC